MPAVDPPSGPHVTYTQQFRRCGKPDCPACSAGMRGHGPYWYAYWRENGKVRSRYLGRQAPWHDETLAGLPARGMRTASTTASTAAPLRVRTLGDFAVWRGETPIPARQWTRRKAGSLFKCLLSASGHRLLREQAAELLWPEAAPSTSTANLRAAIHQLRKTLDEPPAPSHLQTEGEWLVLAPTPGRHPDASWLDAAAFAQAAAAALAGRDIAACRAAVALYGGEYLPGDGYDEWVVGQREELQRQHLAVLLHLAGLAAGHGRVREAARALQVVLKTDPCHEAAARALMRLHIASGRSSEAIQVYHNLARALKRTLDLQPEPETRALYVTLRGVDASDTTHGQDRVLSGQDGRTLTRRR